jgi:dihydropteroate synthase
MNARESPVWRLGDRRLPIDRPIVVGVLNVTPDSFSDGGSYLEPAAAEKRAHQLAEDGADVVDIGGESTRPGAPPVSVEEEWSRIGPVLERLQDSFAPPISVDTTKASVAARALDAGASAINDVSGLRADPGIASLAACSGAGLVLMHMRGDPRTMQTDVDYEDLIGEVRGSLATALQTAADSGCQVDQLIVDPGIGFGKSPEGSLRLLSQLDRFVDLGRPIMVGPSRKSFIGTVLNLPVEERVEATVAACVIALERGARLFRVHDVREVRRALDLADSIRRVDRLAAAGRLTTTVG